MLRTRKETVVTNWIGAGAGYNGTTAGGYGAASNVLGDPAAGTANGSASFDSAPTMPAPVLWRPAVPAGQPMVPPFGPPRRKSRAPLIITLIVVAVITVICVAVIAVVNITGGARGTAGDVVRSYLQALARGDAKSALSYSTDQPASTDLLTDEVLKRQIDKWPITSIQILDDSSTHSGISFAEVHVSAKFGDQTSDVTMTVTRKGGGWKIDHSAIKIDTQTAGADINHSLKTVTIFGKPAEGTLYVFPGWIDVGSSDPNLSVTAKPMLLDSLTTYSGSVFLSGVQVVLSDEGTQAILTAVSNALAQCQKSSSLDPPGCPFEMTDSTLIDGTAVWGPADISQVKVDMFDEYRVQALFSGDVRIPLSAQTRTGGTRSGTTHVFLSGTADVEQSAPEVTFR
jgi:hypothetical protein